MYKVEALIRMERLEEVKNALLAAGIEEFVMAEVRGYCPKDGRAACYRGITYDVSFTPQLRFELHVSKSALDVVVQGILNAASTGQPGDGKIFVTQLGDVVEIDLDRPSTATEFRPLVITRLNPAPESTNVSGGVSRANAPDPGKVSPIGLRS